MTRRDRVTAHCELVIDDNLQVLLVESHEDHTVRLVFDFEECLKRYELRFCCNEDNGKATMDALPSSSSVLCHYMPRPGSGDLSAELTYRVSAMMEGEHAGEFFPTPELENGTSISSITVPIDRYPQLQLEITDIKGGGHGFLLHRASPSSPREQVKHNSATGGMAPIPLEGRWIVLSLKGSANIEWAEVEPYAEEFEDTTTLVDVNEDDGTVGSCGALCVPADKLLYNDNDTDAGSNSGLSNGALRLGSVRLIDPHAPRRLCYRVWAVDRPRAPSLQELPHTVAPAVVDEPQEESDPSPAGVQTAESLDAQIARDSDMMPSPPVHEPNSNSVSLEPSASPETPNNSQPVDLPTIPADDFTSKLNELTLDESEVRSGISRFSEEQWRSTVVAKYIQSTCALCHRPIAPAALSSLQGPLTALVVHPQCAKLAPRCAGCTKLIIGRYLVRVHNSSGRPDEPYHVDCRWRYGTLMED